MDDLGIKDKIEKRKMVHDTKRGVYYLEAYFKDEPNNRYEINLVGSDSELVITAYDRGGSQITDNKIAKYTSPD